jgi:hypothetical protein
MTGGLHPKRPFFYCCVRVHFRGNLFTESLRSNERLRWLRYFGFQASCHNIMMAKSRRPYECRPSDLYNSELSSKIMNRKKITIPWTKIPFIYPAVNIILHLIPSSPCESINLSSVNSLSMIAIHTRKWCGLIDACLLMIQFSSPLRMITSASLPERSAQSTESGWLIYRNVIQQISA